MTEVVLGALDAPNSEIPSELPPYDTSPLAWNAWWESLAKSMHAIDHDVSARIAIFGDPDEPAFIKLRQVYSETCFLQHTLTLNAAFAFAAGFRERWKAADPEERRKHLVEGHFRVFCIGYGESRCLCGDITLTRLEKDEGEGFLRLLEVYVLQDTSVIPTVPISLPYRKLVGTRRMNNHARRAIYTCQRDMYICFFLRGTLESFNGLPRRGSERPARSSVISGVDNTVDFLCFRFFGPECAKQVKKEALSDSVRHCESCTEAEAKRERYMQCATCRDELTRKTFYCSKQCQKDDWPRHKQFCGKELTLATAISTAVPPKKIQFIPLPLQIPAPTKHHPERSLPLIAQIHDLNLHATVDYFLVTNTNPLRPSSSFTSPSDTSFSSTPRANCFPKPQFTSLTVPSPLSSAFRQVRHAAITSAPTASSFSLLSQTSPTHIDPRYVAALAEFLTSPTQTAQYVREGRYVSVKAAREEVFAQLGREFETYPDGEQGMRRDVWALRVKAFWDANVGVGMRAGTQVERAGLGMEVDDPESVRHRVGWDATETAFEAQL